MKRFAQAVAPVMLLLLALSFGSLPYFVERNKAHADGISASADCNLNAVEATIVCDSTTSHATMLATVQKGGYLVNGGSNSVFINFSGGAIAGTNAQNTTGEVEFPALATIPVRPSCRVFSYQAATSTSVLYWYPSE